MTSLKRTYTYPTKKQSAQRERILRERILAYEIQYGISSDEIHDRIESGELQETQEVCMWIFDCERLRHMGNQ